MDHGVKEEFLYTSQYLGELRMASLEKDQFQVAWVEWSVSNW